MYIKALSTTPGTEQDHTELAEAQCGWAAGKGEGGNRLLFWGSSSVPGRPLLLRWRNKHRDIGSASRMPLPHPSSPDTHDLPWAEVNTGHRSYKYPFPFQTGVTSNGSILSGWGMGRGWIGVFIFNEHQ